jgi:hypothetical protein
MTQLDDDQKDASVHMLRDDEKEIIKSIRDKIHKNIDGVSPAVAYELSQVLGLVSQIVRTKDIDDENPGLFQSATRALFGKPYITTPREELLEILETAAIVLTESAKENKAEQRQRIVFAREILHQLDTQTRHFPNPMASLFRQYTSLEDRLLSGIVWFFSLFFVLPLGATMILLWASSNAANKELTNINNLNVLLNRIQTNQETTKSTLSQVRNDIDTLINSASTPVPDGDSSIDSSVTGQNPIPSDSIVNVSIPSLRSIQQIVDVRLAAEIDNPVTSINEIINSKGSSEDVNQYIEFALDFFGIKGSTFFSTDIFFILIAISMGALGSSVSVITASDRFLNITKSRKVDPFYIGFFRPFVGMAFAIFVVALIESGVFSSILQVPEGAGGESQTRKVYLFAAIAFVAGFSERFAPGLAEQVSGTPLREKEPDQPQEDEQA